MYKVFPVLILRAAKVRAQCLELGSLSDYGTSPSTLVAAAPSATNVYTLAFGEREGLAPGERLEVYGNKVRLVRTLAYGCPRGVTPESAFTGRLKDAELAAITEQLDLLRRETRRPDTLLHTAQDSDASAQAHRSVTTAFGEEPRRPSEWMLRLPNMTNSRVLRNAVPDDPQACSGRSLAAQLSKLRVSEEEVVVAEWVGKPKGASEAAAGASAWSPRSSSAGVSTRADHSTSAAAAAETNPNSSSAGTISALPATPCKGGAAPPPGAGDTLLMENGVCFRNPDSCGLRALRTARLAFISSIERTANGLAWRQRRQTCEEARGLTVLDASAIDFTFAQAALQSTLELGLHAGAGCQISHVPLTDAAAAHVESQAATYIRVVAAGPGRALPRPFDYLPTHSIDVGAYTAHLPLPVEPAAKEDGGSGGEGSAASRRGCKSSGRDARANRQQLAVQLSQALATLRRGAFMLVTFVPTCSSVATLYHQMETQRRAEVLIEHKVVTEAKACIAEAIARTGRWGFITDEVLPAADSAQGSSFSLIVMLE
ncbi:conserved hypothetical protein [Leishmania major strain Friedlin]|uniref:Uncharacterized protein n=1 Tax=Leishmania major TaxID=5664 RepID=Q4QCI7_LEIMA|nr:conserved hypothetical protein [Leishmania major strain Friedlin]CAG9573283.1 hypothetical_protein_-_conserved [Leishmania major strain Friedlin]CAJ03865.1 conserved hypothetical protein [Leishmania major strain Friedlin]|eukprot:XP_001682961.1 conserved hypothetical protein [Leishmania major strain Friedlin]